MNYQRIATSLRRQILTMSYEARGTHISSSLSCVDLLTVLYFKILKINPRNPLMTNRDRFILSKGHAAAALYAVLAERGFFSANLLKQYIKNGSQIAGHPSRGCLLGVEASTGSLGHGLPIAAGIALAAKKDRKKYRVFVLLSDGECDEGSNWEAGLFSSHHQLDNLIGLIDYNKLQAFGPTNEVLRLEPFSKKWQSFGWSVREINGHNFVEIEKTLAAVPFEKDKPTMIIAHTIKGKGISFMENKLEWHYKNLTSEEYHRAIKELSK